MKAFPIALAAAVMSCSNALADPDLKEAGPISQSISAVQLGGGDRFFFSHRISNTGTSGSGPITVTYYLSDDTKLNPDTDIALQRSDFAGLGEGETVAVQSDLLMPQTPPTGTFYLVWLIETADDRNPLDNVAHYRVGLNAPLIPPGFDLRPGSAAFHSLRRTTVAPGRVIVIDWQICNEGPTASTGFFLRHLLSENPTIGDADDVVLSLLSFPSIDQPPLAAARRCEQRSWSWLRLPETLAPGTYYIGYEIDAAADSVPNNNSFVYDSPITVALSSAVVDLYDAGPVYHDLTDNTPRVGEHVVVVTGIHNGGSHRSAGYEVTYSARPLTNITSDHDIILATESFAGLEPTESMPQLIQAVLPTDNLDPDESYWIVWEISGGNDGNIENNTTVSSIPIHPFSGEFAFELGSDWTASGSLFAPGGCLVVEGTVNNVGTLAARYSLEVYLRKTDDPFETRRTFQASLGSHSEVPAGGSRHQAYSMSLSSFINGDGLPIGLDRSDYEVTVVVKAINPDAAPGRAPRETDFFGNLIIPDGGHQISGEITLANPSGLPDLVISWIPFEFNLQTSLTAGGTIEVSGRVRNTGLGVAPPTSINFKINGMNFGSIPVPETILPGESASFRTTLTAANNLPPGEYVITGIVDNADEIAELNECNNDFEFTTVSVGEQADLAQAPLLPSRQSRPEPTALLQGVQASHRFEVTNLGASDAGQFRVKHYLSTDNTISASDTLVSERSYLGLGAGDTTSMDGAINVPIGTPDGIYFLLWVIDEAGEVPENNEANNTGSFSQRVFVGARANLREGDTPFAASETNLLPGQTFVMNGSQRNSGSTEAGPHWNHVVLAATPVPDGSDRLIDSQFLGRIASPADSEFNISRNITIPETVAPGEYWLVYIFDATNLVDETHESDNSVAIPVSVQKPLEAPPKIYEFYRDGNDITLIWSSRQDLSYQLQRTTDYTKWLNFGDQVSGEKFSTQQSFKKAANEIGPRAGYRIVESP